MAKHDIVVLNSTSSGFETDLGNNVARIKGDADDLFSVRDASGINKFSVSTLDESLILNSNVTSSGHISSSLNSTASFGRVDVTNLVGDGSQMTNTNETAHVSSSAQLASRISGAFQHGFELEGENRVISGSATSTGSFTRVFANVYSGDASDMFNTKEDGNFSGSAQLASNISGAFNQGFELAADSEISGSATSTGSFGQTIASKFTGNASQTTGVLQALAAGTLSGSAQIASNVSGAFNQGFELSSRTTTISGSVTSTGSFGTMVMGQTLGLIHDISDTSELTGFSIGGLISSSAQLATSISGSFTSGMSMFNSQVSGSATSTGSFTRVDGILSISGDASETTGVTLPSGVLSGSGGIASYVSGAFSHGFEFTGLTREEILTGSYAGVSGSDFAYAGNATTMSISSICGSDFDYRKYDRLNGRIQGQQAFEAGGVWITSTGLPADRNAQVNLGTVDAALLAAGYVAPAYVGSTLKFDGVTYSNSADLNQGRGNAVGAGTQNAAMVNGGQSGTSPYRQYVGYTEHYNGSTWSEQADSTGEELGGGGFGTQNAAVRVGGLTPQSSPANYPNNTEIWNGTSWSNGPDHNDSNRRFFGSGGSFNAGIIAAGGTYPGSGNKSETWDGTSWTVINPTVQSVFGNSLAGSSNSAHTVGTHCQVNGGQFSNVFDGLTYRIGPNLSNLRGFAGTNAAGLSSCHLYAGGSSFPSSPWNTHRSCTEIYTARNLTTGSFARVDMTGFKIHNIQSSSLTGYDANHVSGAAQIASQISGAFQHGFQFDGTISGSVGGNSTLRIQNLVLGGTNTFGETKLIKKWNTSFVQSATYGTSLGAAISGAFNHGFGFEGTISGSSTSTGSFNKIQSQELFVKEMAGKRKPISGSMDHDNYISASYKSDSHGRITIPTFGRGHTVNTQQFTATGSMEDQKYRDRAGQLFVDNFGRLNFTVQTGSMVEVPGAWEAGPTGFFTEGPGNSAATGTPNAIIQSAPWGYQKYSGSAIYDGIAWNRVSDVTGGHGSFYYANCSIGTVDAALFLRHTGGVAFGTNTGKYGSFPNLPGHTTYMELWDGVGWYRGPLALTSQHVKRNGTSGKVGSVNSHIAFNGSEAAPTGIGTAAWNGATWQDVGPFTPTARDGGGGFGGVYDGVVAGGVAPNNTCVDEWNGVSWATATALPTGQTRGGGAGPQTAGIIMGGSPQAEVQEWNGTSWSEGTSIPVNFTNHASGGSVGKAFVATSFCSYFWTGGFVTGSADTHNEFSQNPTGRYLLTKKLQANYSPGCAGGVSTSNDEDFGGGY